MKLIKLVGNTIGIIIGCIIGLSTLLWLNSSVQPVTLSPNPNPGLTGVFTPNSLLDQSQLILQNLGQGPEDIVLGDDGYV